MKQLLNKNGFAFGVVLISLITIVQNISLIPVSQSAAEKDLSRYVEKKIQGSINDYHNNADELQNATFENPIYLYEEGRLKFWSDINYHPPLEIFHRTDTIYKYELKELQGLVQSHKDGDKTLVILIPIIRSSEYIPENGLNCLRPIDHITTLHFGEKIKFEFDSLPKCKTSPYFIWFQLILLLLGSILIFPKTYAYLKKIRKFPEIGKSNLYLLLLNLLLLPTAFLPVFEENWFTASLGENSFSPVTPLLLISSAGFLLILLTTMPFNKKQTRDWGSGSWKKYIISLISYILIGVWGLLMIAQYEYIYRLSGIDLHLEELFSFSMKEITFLIIFIFLFVVFFTFSQFIFKLINYSRIQLPQKIAGILITVFLLYISSITGWVDIDPVLLILAYLILVVTLDLYQDRKSLNSTWIFTWMILISAYVSFLAFSIDYNSDEHRLEASLHNIIQNRDLEFESMISDGIQPSSEDKYITEWVDSSPEVYRKLREKYISIAKNLYFNPLTGDYYIANELLKTKTIPVRHYYINKELMQRIQLNDIPEKYILLHQGKKIMDHYEADISDRFQQHFSNRDTSSMLVNGYALHFMHGPDELTILHLKKLPGLLRPVSLFSLLFFILSVILFLLSVINTKMMILPKQLNLQFFERKSLRNRIQISIISLIIVSFFIIGIVTNYYLRNLAENTDQVIQTSQIQLLQHDLQGVLDKDSWTPVGKVLKDYSLDQSMESGRLIYFFDAEGKKMEDFRNFHTNLPGDNQINMIPFRSFAALNMKNDKAGYWINSDNIRGMVFPVRKNGSVEINAFAFVPGKHERFSLQNISDIFATFLNIYSFLFIISGGIAIGLANSITNPIEILGKKLKGLKLSNKNETVQWKNEDEIGALITIYNDMIHKLSDNAKVMAKVERDSAWKEMAKQVAHEIKNPLTPLKLNIQYLESKVRMNPEDAPGLIEQIAPSLIEQIDNLSEIASEFSNFAQLPTARNEQIRLNEIVKTVHDFFRKREDLTFQLFVPINDVLVFADRNHLVRIMNNVVKNAIQSIPSDRQGEIILRLYRKDDNAIIQVTDNGSGIPEEMHDKVFSPNFTTKSSGTGLGLAISTNMLESFNGRIYFKTIENLGTDFFIEIPLMRFEDNYPEVTRVLLDD